MIKQLTSHLAVCVLAVFMAGTACEPEKGKPGGNKPPAKATPRVPNPGPGNPNYMVHVRAHDGKHPNLERVSRILYCLVNGLSANGDIVNVTDARTGETGKYQLTVRDETPARLLLYNYANVSFIQVACLMTGKPGDSVTCEFVMGDDERVAPLVRSVEFDTVPRGGKYAECSGTITTRS